MLTLLNQEIPDVHLVSVERIISFQALLYSCFHHIIQDCVTGEFPQGSILHKIHIRLLVESNCKMNRKLYGTYFQWQVL